jgi:hypothetical protein
MPVQRIASVRVVMEAVKNGFLALRVDLENGSTVRQGRTTVKNSDPPVKACRTVKVCANKADGTKAISANAATRRKSRARIDSPSRFWACGLCPTRRSGVEILLQQRNAIYICRCQYMTLKTRSPVNAW